MSELISVRQILAEYASNEYSAELLLKHAIEHLKMTQQQAEPQRVTMAHMDALHKAIDHVAALQNNRLRFRSACEISGDKHPEYVRGYEAAMDAVCKTQPAPIPTSERLPTKEDADCRCEVWAYKNNYEWDLYYWGSVRQHSSIFTFWLPTGLKIPPAPGGSDE